MAGLMRSLSTKGREGRQLLERQLQKVNGNTFYPRRAAKDHEGPRRTATATAELQRLHLFPRRTRRATENGNCRKGNCRRSTANPFFHEGPRRTAKNGNCRTATATPFSTEDTEGHGERQLQDRQLLRVNGKTFYPRRAAKNVNCNCRTATATPFCLRRTLLAQQILDADFGRRLWA